MPTPKPVKRIASIQRRALVVVGESSTDLSDRLLHTLHHRFTLLPNLLTRGRKQFCEAIVLLHLKDDLGNEYDCHAAVKFPLLKIKARK